MSAPFQHRVERREFLKLAGVVAAGAVTENVVAPARAVATESPEQLAIEHATDPAILIDVTRCIGCGYCTLACKSVNDLPRREDQPFIGPRAELAESNLTVVRELDVPASPEAVKEGATGPDRYAKRQCMQCLEPACVSVCPVKAMTKTPQGPVAYDGNMCIGCRFCLLACPFGVPTFEWDRSFGRIHKCEMCRERQAKGLQPACTEVCPVDAIVFGKRDELLTEARKRISERPGRYIDHIYGETEAGGTSVLYLSDVPFEALGLPAGVPSQPLPSYTWKISRLIPVTATGVLVTLSALYARRRRYLLEHSGEWQGRTELEEGKTR